MSTSNPKPPKRAISRRSFLGTSLAVGGVVFVMALAQNSAPAGTLAEFSGGIGVIPTGSANTTVRGVAAAGQIWVIQDLEAEVENGRIELDGRGLLLGSGNAVGSNANARVFATLFCANAGNVQHNSNLAGVPLEVNGDFRIDDRLSPAPPNLCTSPVLLIRSAGSGSWFAAGIPGGKNGEKNGGQSSLLTQVGLELGDGAPTANSIRGSHLPPDEPTRSA